jgi:protein-L-isoaspartate(D-aspartate) O-methyltransferase
MRYASADLVRSTRRAGVDDERVLDAVARTPRELFVPAQYAGRAYADEPIPIGQNQVTSQPSLIAQMIAALRLTEESAVLEIGTGYGYQTALLARLARHVYSVERWPDLADHARRNLASAGVRNASVVVGDGMLGLPAHAPYDGIVVSAVGDHVPEPLAAQLAEGGRLVQPLLSHLAEAVVLFVKESGRLVEVETLTPACFVPLVPGTADPLRAARSRHRPG